MIWWLKNNYTYIIILILLGIIAFKYFKTDDNLELKSQLEKLHKENDSLFNSITSNKIKIQKLDSLTKTYELKIEQDKVELAKLKSIADKNKQKYNEEHNRIITLSNSDVVREFTNSFE